MEWLASLLVKTGIAAFGDSFFKPYLQHLTDEGKIAADLAKQELDLQKREAELSTQLRIAQIGRWYEPEHLFSYVLVFYFSKVVVWDIMLDLGSTPPLRGSIAEWAGMIMLALFGKRGIENVARILRK